MDINGFAVAAMTVPMLARIDGEKQAFLSEVEEKLRKSAAHLSGRIAPKNTE